MAACRQACARRERRAEIWATQLSPRERQDVLRLVVPDILNQIKEKFQPSEKARTCCKTCERKELNRYINCVRGFLAHLKNDPGLTDCYGPDDFVVDLQCTKDTVGLVATTELPTDVLGKGLRWNDPRGCEKRERDYISKEISQKVCLGCVELDTIHTIASMFEQRLFDSLHWFETAAQHEELLAEVEGAAAKAPTDRKTKKRRKKAVKCKSPSSEQPVKSSLEETAEEEGDVTTNAPEALPMSDDDESGWTLITQKQKPVRCCPTYDVSVKLTPALQLPRAAVPMPLQQPVIPMPLQQPVIPMPLQQPVIPMPLQQAVIPMPRPKSTPVANKSHLSAYITRALTASETDTNCVEDEPLSVSQPAPMSGPVGSSLQGYSASAASPDTKMVDVIVDVARNAEDDLHKAAELLQGVVTAVHGRPYASCRHGPVGALHRQCSDTCNGTCDTWQSPFTIHGSHLDSGRHFHGFMCSDHECSQMRGCYGGSLFASGLPQVFGVVDAPNEGISDHVEWEHIERDGQWTRLLDDCNMCHDHRDDSSLKPAPMHIENIELREKLERVERELAEAQETIQRLVLEQSM